MNCSKNNQIISIDLLNYSDEILDKVSNKSYSKNKSVILWESIELPII